MFFLESVREWYSLLFVWIVSNPWFLVIPFWGCLPLFCSLIWILAALSLGILDFTLLEELLFAFPKLSLLKNGPEWILFLEIVFFLKFNHFLTEVCLFSLRLFSLRISSELLFFSCLEYDLVEPSLGVENTDLLSTREPISDVTFSDKY